MVCLFIRQNHREKSSKGPPEKSYATTPNSNKGISNLHQVVQDLVHLSLEISRMRSHSLSGSCPSAAPLQEEEFFLVSKYNFPSCNLGLLLLALSLLASEKSLALPYLKLSFRQRKCSH